MNDICKKQVHINLQRERALNPYVYTLCLFEDCWTGMGLREIIAKCQSGWVTSGWQLNLLAQSKDKNSQWSLPRRFDKEQVRDWKPVDDSLYWIGVRLIRNELYPEFSTEELILRPMDEQNLDDCDLVLSELDFYKKYPIGTSFCVKGALFGDESEPKIFLTTGEDDSYAVVDPDWCFERIWEHKLGRYSLGKGFFATGTKKEIDLRHRHKENAWGPSVA